MNRLRGEYRASLAVAAWLGAASSPALAMPPAALAASEDVVLVGAGLTVYVALALVLGMRWGFRHSLMLTAWAVVAAVAMGVTASAVPLSLIALATVAVCQWALVRGKSRGRQSK